MNELITILKEKKVDEAFLVIGLSFDEYFRNKIAGKEANPYQDYEWIVKVVPVFGHIVNAVPIDKKMDKLFWEEWFTKDGTIYHHILYLKELAQYDEIFEAPEQDDIHPKQVLGKKWYVIDDKDLSPVLLRS